MPRTNRRSAASRPRQDWQGRIERLGWGGVGVGRLDDGRVVLLRSTLALFPGELVTAELELHRRHAEGIVAGWLERDPRRMPAACPVAAECGGCSLWEAGPAAAELKWQMVQDLLARQLRDAPECEWLPAPTGTRRSRIQLHWDGARLGFHRQRSNELVPVQTCPMATPPVAAAIPALTDALLAGTLPNAPGRWELATDTPPGQVLAVAHTPASPSWTCKDAAWQESDRPLWHDLGGMRFRQIVGAFFQACPDWAWHVFSKIFRGWQVSGQIIYDCYGGGGFFTIMLAEAFMKAVVIESDGQACADAEFNLSAACGVHPAFQAEVVCADVAEWLPDGLGTAGDTILLDPPRAGLPASVCERLLTADAASLILIGCDGMAFCRDAQRLAPRWTLQRLAAIDLFPNTPEIEFVGLFTSTN